MLDKLIAVAKSFNKISLFGFFISIFLLMIVLYEAEPCQANESEKQQTLRKVANEWIQVGTEQYQRFLFKAAEQSFQQAQAYQEYLSAIEREKLNVLLQNAITAESKRKQMLEDIQKADILIQQGQPFKAKTFLDNVKESELLKKDEKAQIAEKLKQINSQLIGQNRKIESISVSPTTITKSNTETIASQSGVLAPGDVIEVKFFYTPELDVSQTVRPDGKIALQLVGDVKVQGKTPSELKEELLGLFTPLLNDPEITIIVLSFYERRVFVGGQVMKPGIVQMPGRMEILEAIMEAGGFDLREAEVKNVIVIRHKDGQRLGFSLDLKAALKGKKTQPFYLEPKDIVYISRTKIAEVNQWIDQHINKIIPRTGFIFTVPVGDDGRIGIY